MTVYLFFLGLDHLFWRGHWPDWIVVTEWRRSCATCAFRGPR